MNRNQKAWNFLLKNFMLFFIISLPLTGFGQPVQFTKDSVPLVEGEIIFTVDFKADLRKEEFHKKTYTYLNDLMNPYIGTISMDNENFTLSRITDYINIKDNAIQSFGMYMTYNLQFGYKDGLCTMVIRDISFMEKSYFEAKEESTRKLNMPQLPGKDVMVDKKYSLLLIKNASEKITEASLKRINGIIKNLDASFSMGKNSSSMKNTDQT